MLPPEPGPANDAPEDDPYADSEEEEDPSLEWQSTHAAIGDTISALGGRAYPKLNWSAPKDATWIAADNSMQCTSPNDVYLLLKSSDFVTHDLDQPFDGCEDDTGQEMDSRSLADDLPYHLVLRKSIPALITSMEFRCFVRRRRLLGFCQRELKHYEFMGSLASKLRSLIQEFFDRELRDTFPDPNFVFDVYIPRPEQDGRVWLIDFNPWAPRTDPLLFSWLELLEMPEPSSRHERRNNRMDEVADGVVRLRLKNENITPSVAEEAEEGSSDDEVEDVNVSDFRMVGRDDPENYSFNTPLYSAHKLPLDVVAAGMSGEGGIRDFLNHWNSTTTAAENGTVSNDSDD